MSLKEIEEELKRRGIRVVSFFRSPYAKEMSINKVTRDAKRLLEAYLQGKTKLIKSYKPK